jgi:hypothetical protein
MHNQALALDTFNIVWKNYLTLLEAVEWEPPQNPAPGATISARELRNAYLAEWLCVQGCFVSIWNLWEYYAKQVCERLTTPINRNGNESFPQYVQRALVANGQAFADADWFKDANAFRNLIVHFYARVGADARSQDLWARTQVVFPSAKQQADNYVWFDNDVVAELATKVETFIEEHTI